MSKKKILILTGRYLPGYKDGGPVRSIKNLTDFLGNEYDFHILTCDRDHGDECAYENIEVNTWNRVGNANVYYVPPKGFTFNILQKLAYDADLIYICGCFSDYAMKTLFLNKIGIIKTPIIVASMGLFSPKEFQLKYLKKKIFVSLCNILGIFKNIYWSLTSEIELEEIRQQIWLKENYFIAEDLPRKVEYLPLVKEKKQGQLRIVWISRITPKKNLLGAIEILHKVNSDVIFSIYGPIQDELYWNKCKIEIDRLPNNIKCIYKGTVESEMVVNEFKKHHIFLFPTLGENYGHVIQEALSAGCPCVLSDQTPWINLDKEGVGHTFPIKKYESYVSVIEKYAKMNEHEYTAVSNKTLEYIIRDGMKKIENTGYRKMFNKI